jgi:chromosome segregation ATPase
MAITIEQLQSQIDELQSQLGKASEHGSDLLQALKTERGRIADLEQELAAQASRFEDGGAELKSAAGWAKADQRRLRTELGAALAAEAVAVAQLEDDKDVVAAKDRELEVFKRRFGEQSQEIIRLRAMLAEVDFERRDVQSLQARLTLLEGAKLGYDKEKVELEAQKAAAEERAADLELQLTDLRAQSAAAEKRSAVIESQLADLRGQGQELLVKTPSLQHTAITTATPHQASIIDKIEEIKRALSASGERVKSLSEELRATKEEAAVQATRHAAELDTAKAKTVEQAARHARELDAAKAETAAQAARHVAELDTAKAETAKQAASHARELDAAKAETAKQAVRHAAELDTAKAKTVEQAASHARELDAANKDGVAKTKFALTGMSDYGKASNELFTQFVARIAREIPTATVAMFSTLKYVNAPNFEKFRQAWNAKYV